MSSVKYFDKNIYRKSAIIKDSLQFIKGTNFPLPSVIEISDSGTCNRTCSFCPRSDPGYEDIKEFISATMILFAIIDIVGNIPLIVLFREKFKVIESEKASLVSLIIMIVFLYIGEILLNLLGVDINSFAVAGSIIILFLAAEMILGIKIYKDNNPKTASVVPIAFPLIAGPGTLTTLISIKSEYNDINIILAIILNMVLVYIVLKSSEKLQKILGSQGINILRKVFGIILLAIGIKLFTTNIKLIFA